jgi:hypothetical protein
MLFQPRGLVEPLTRFYDWMLNKACGTATGKGVKS